MFLKIEDKGRVLSLRDSFISELNKEMQEFEINEAQLRKKLSKRLEKGNLF